MNTDLIIADIVVNIFEIYEELKDTHEDAKNGDNVNDMFTYHNLGGQLCVYLKMLKALKAPAETIDSINTIIDDTIDMMNDGMDALIPQYKRIKEEGVD